MPFINADRIKETTTTTGTGAITLAGAVLGFRAFYPTLSVGDTFKYFIVSTSGTEWESGLGTLTASSTLARTTVQSSSNVNPLTAVNFSAGLKEVGIGPTAGGETPWNPVTNTLDISVNALNDVAITSPTVNQVLKYSGTEWTNQADAVNVGTVTSVSGAGTVSGLTLTGTVTSSGSLTLGGTLSAIPLATGVSGTLPVANGGTGVTTSTGTTNVVLSNSPTLVTPLSNSLSAVPVASELTASVTAATGASGIITYTAANTFTVGRTVSVTGLGISSGSDLNISNMTIATASSTQFTVVNATAGVSSGTGTATAGGHTLAVTAGSGVGNCKGGSLILSAGAGAGIGAGGNVETKPGTQGSSGGDGRNYWRTSGSVNTRPSSGWSANTSNVVAYSFISASGHNTFNIGPDESNWSNAIATHNAYDTPLSVRHPSESSSFRHIAAFYTSNANRTSVVLGTSLTEAHIGASWGVSGTAIDLVFSSITAAGSGFANLRLKATGETQVTGFLTTNALAAIPVTSGAGNSVTIAAGSGVTSGAGGSLILQAGLQAATGGDGKVIVKQVAGQTSNFFEVQLSGGTPLISVTPASGISLTDGGGAAIQIGMNKIDLNQNNGSPINFHTGAAAGGGGSICDFRSSSVLCGGYNATAVPIIVRSHASQSANLQEWRNSAGTALASVDAAGNISAGPIIENKNTISANKTITAGSNGMSVGPITVNTGITVTVGANQRWVVL